MFDWTSLILQVPIVAAFIWYAITTQKQNQEYNEKAATRFQESMDKRDAQYLAVLGKISDQLDAHDHKVETRINTLDHAARITHRPRKEGQ